MTAAHNGGGENAERKEGLNELALFAGAGGGILGGHLLGWRTICAVEWADYLAAHPDSTVQAAREYLLGGGRGLVRLSDAELQMDQLGAPAVAYMAIRRAWAEWDRRPRMAEHDFAQMVNNLRDIGRKYGDAGQLRERIAWELARWIEVKRK